ncbi:MAG: histidine phosphatase family protein [Propionibacteriaceae bacterium]|jgi:probable phosphoglycerate mutase|nr:histidine phosphatase family protein [Propionibacteriaceae bacterium]
MRLILVRHGETENNTAWKLDTAVPGGNLSNHGKDQAQQLVQRFQDEDIAALYASTLVRTQQTIAPLSKALDLPVTVLDGLREVPAGDDEMSTDATRYAEMMMAWMHGDPTAKIPGGQNLVEFMARYDAAINEIEQGPQSALAVSHGAALLVWCHARVRGFAETVGKMQLDNTASIVADGDLGKGYELVGIEGLHELGSGRGW